MARLIYSAIMSLDGYIEDENGEFGWAVPDDEVHAFINELERPIGTFLYGRRMYETMAAWETNSTLGEQSPLMRDFAQVWQAADKIVFSRTLEGAFTGKTRIERDFDADRVRQLKASSTSDVSIGGPDLAAHAEKTGLIDEYRLFVVPVVVAGGKPALPHGVRSELHLLEEQRFNSGIVYLRYRATT